VFLSLFFCSENGFGDNLIDKSRRAHDLSLLVDAWVFGITFGQQRFPIFQVNFIVELKPGFDLGIQRGLNHENIIVFGRSGVFTMGFGYRKKYAIFLYGFVCKPQKPEHFTATDLKPAKVVPIIGLAHVVRIPVNDAVSCAMTEHIGFPWNDELIVI
jgi:hypothetical protein